MDQALLRKGACEGVLMVDTVSTLTFPTYVLQRPPTLLVGDRIWREDYREAGDPGRHEDPIERLPGNEIL